MMGRLQKHSNLQVNNLKALGYDTERSKDTTKSLRELYILGLSSTCFVLLQRLGYIEQNRDLREIDPYYIIASYFSIL